MLTNNINKVDAKFFLFTLEISMNTAVLVIEKKT